MKFTKLAKSDKFEYMMLSRLIQDAKYFIDHPNLKHLWARTLDEHIKQMKEQYAKLDPKPEWISEEEINNLAKQMKESYTNHWNEVHPDNKIEASDNFEVGDKVFFDTLYEFQEDDLGFNYDRGILKEIKHWPSNNREYYIIQTDDGKLLQVGNVFHTEEDMEAFRNNLINPKFEKESKKKDKEYTILYRSEKEREADSDFHTYKVLKDKKSAIELAKDLFKKMNYEGEVNVDSGDYNYYSTDNYDWDKINKMNLKDYKQGYKDGKDDYEIGHPADPDDLKDNFSEEYIEGYWQGFNDAQEKEFYRQSAITQPNKPKPTTMLPDNMQWAWDPDAADWVAVLKDNTNTTPPLYDHNNQNAVNNTTTYMSNIKSASVIDSKEDEDPLSVKLSDLFLSDSSLVDSYIKKEINCDDILDILGIKINNKNEYKEACNYIKEFINDNYINNIKSSCLSKFLDGPQYSKEIKVEAGLIKDGLVKYAGFDFNRGTKYAITTKGLEALRKASEAEHNEALNEKEKLAYLFCFNTDKETTLDTTGKVIKQSARKWTICEADGTELGEVEADSELDAKVKFGIEHPEYADSQSISAKEICASETEYMSVQNMKAFLKQQGAKEISFGTFTQDVPHSDSDLVKVIESHGTKKINLTYDHYKVYVYTNGARMIEDLAKYNGNWKDRYFIFTNVSNNKNIDAKYEETTNTKEPYPNPSETPTTDVVLENHDGWVNTAEQKVTPEFAQLHSILGDYKKNGHILSITQDGKDLLVSCSPIASYEMKQKFEQLGYECEETDESETGDAYDLPSYTLRIKMR